MNIPEPNNKDKKKILDWHSIFASSLKKYSKWKITEEFQIPTSRIDLVVETIKSDERVSHLLDNYFLRSNIIEFKSFYESLKL